MNSSSAAINSPNGIDQRATRKFLVWLLAVSILFFGAAYAYISWSTSPARISDPAYYTGPIRNHRGDLATIDGRIIESAKHPVRFRAATAN